MHFVKTYHNCLFLHVFIRVIKIRRRSPHFQTEITSVEFSRKTPGKLLGGYRYKPVEPYLLPKGFEGILQVENLSDGHMTLHVTSRQVQVKVNVGGGVLRLVQVSRCSVTTDSSTGFTVTIISRKLIESGLSNARKFRRIQYRYNSIVDIILNDIKPLIIFIYMSANLNTIF